MSLNAKPDQESGAADRPPMTRTEVLAAYEASGYDLGRHPAHMIRRVMLRMTAYLNYINPF